MVCFEFQPLRTENCQVYAYLQKNGASAEKKGRKLPVVVICPGGGYLGIADREGEPVAKEFFGAGYQAFVLHYATGDQAVDFVPLCQLASTVAHIRAHAEEWNIDEHSIAVCGFSAGGHLAASLGTLFNEEKFLKVWKREENIRPDAMILGYPVILADEYSDEESIEAVSGAKKGTPEYEWFGLDKHVDNMTPATFLWHTAADTGVSVENSLAFAAALSKVNVPFEFHVFPEGEHGMSVCTQEVGTPDSYNGRWVKWSIEWLNRQFSFLK